MPQGNAVSGIQSFVHDQAPQRLDPDRPGCFICRRGSAVRTPGLKIEQFEGEPCVIAVDLASKTDLAAVIVLFERDRKIIPFGRFYLPQSAIDGSRHAAYRGWTSKAWLIPTPATSSISP